MKFKTILPTYRSIINTAYPINFGSGCKMQNSSPFFFAVRTYSLFQQFNPDHPNYGSGVQYNNKSDGVVNNAGLENIMYDIDPYAKEVIAKWPKHLRDQTPAHINIENLPEIPYSFKVVKKTWILRRDKSYTVDISRIRNRFGCRLATPLLVRPLYYRDGRGTFVVPGPAWIRKVVMNINKLYLPVPKQYFDEAVQYDRIQALIKYYHGKRLTREEFRKFQYLRWGLTPEEYVQREIELYAAYLFFEDSIKFLPVYERNINRHLFYLATIENSPEYTRQKFYAELANPFYGAYVFQLEEDYLLSLYKREFLYTSAFLAYLFFSPISLLDFAYSAAAILSCNAAWVAVAKHDDYIIWLRKKFEPAHFLDKLSHAQQRERHVYLNSLFIKANKKLKLSWFFLDWFLYTVQLALQVYLFSIYLGPMIGTHLAIIRIYWLKIHWFVVYKIIVIEPYIFNISDIFT